MVNVRPERVLAPILLAVACAGCQARTGRHQYTIVDRTPHDSTAYTQGLLLHDGQLYESTGIYGQSQVRRLDVATGGVVSAVRLPSDRFGEGLARVGDRLYQLTWHHGVGYVYDVTTLALVDSFTYQGEGWGLTSDDTSLVMSNGSATLRFLDPTTFAVTREVEVRDGASPLSSLNELEYVNGELLANVFGSAWIVRINPASGQVLEWLDFADLVPDRLRGSQQDVLNGIAFDAVSGDVLLTGKRWPVLYRVRLLSGNGRRASANTRPNQRLHLAGAAK